MSDGFPQALVVQHVELPTQQRRLRHLTSISARNLCIRGFESTLIDSYFTLHLQSDKHRTEFFRSEIIHNSLNPEWKSFHPHNFSIQPYSSCIVVRVWCGVGGEDFRIALQWNVDLPALTYVGPCIISGRSYASNTLLFGMFNSQYEAPPYDNLSEAVLFKSLQVPSIRCHKSRVQHTYSLDVLSRFHGLHRRLAASRHRVRKTKDAVAKHADMYAERYRLTGDYERAQSRTSLLREELERQQQCLGEERAQLQSRKEFLLTKIRQKETDSIVFHSNHADLLEGVQGLSGRRQVCRASVKSLKLTRAWLASDLLNVLPIVQVSETQYTIGDISLPASESLTGVSEKDLAVSCGFVAQMVDNLSRILVVPLRHAIIFNGSQSLIRDDMPAKVINDERELCLYPRQRLERDDFFKVAMFLLNANILQLRQYVHIGTADPRRTLHNLKGLLDRLATQCNRAGASLNITATDSLPSCTFGRPLPHMRSRKRNVTVQESGLVVEGEEASPSSLNGSCCGVSSQGSPGSVTGCGTGGEFDPLDDSLAIVSARNGDSPHASSAEQDERRKEIVPYMI